MTSIGRFLLLLTVGLLSITKLWASTIHHDLHVKLEPSESLITVSDHIQLPLDSMDSFDFSLRSSLLVSTQDAVLTTVGKSKHGLISYYRLSELPENRKVKLDYRGKFKTNKTPDQFGMPEYLLSNEGMYLDSSSAWWPQFKQFPWITFNLQVEAPSNWEIISQGRRQKVNGAFHFVMPQPQDDVFLLGGKFVRYQQIQDNVELVIYLLEADARLAENYLQATAHYINFYSDLIGPYPYAKFAIVENRWQTGYGMPSFTLLGSRVIRLPFILHTSLPHEIVHNWWGNGVYVDYSDGNWSEGLTAYQSDHLDSEQRNQGAAYRRKALERYANFAAEARDFPLANFRARHSDASQAIGYSKSLMLFHMLRQQVGNEIFNQRIRQFWQRYQFQTASYRDLIQTLLADNKSETDTFVSQWLHRSGAPKLSLGKVQTRKTGTGHQLLLEVIQEQSSPPYRLQVPVDVILKDDKAPHRSLIHLTGRRTRIILDFVQQPQVITLDPDYDVFRLLDPQERPASLGRLFGAKTQLLVLPTEGNTAQKNAWQQLAKSWSSRFDNIEISYDNELTDIPSDKAVWLLGWQNKLLKLSPQRFNAANQNLQNGMAAIAEKQLRAINHAVVLLDPDNSRPPLGFIGAESPDSIALLARKLPHYGSYGQLAFELPQVNNIIKNSLPVKVSPLKRTIE